jgi:hypothetical protein
VVRNPSACARTAAERCAYVVEVEVEVESARGRFLGEIAGSEPREEGFGEGSRCDFPEDLPGEERVV